MKKILALILALCMVFALCACGAGETASAPAVEEPAAEAPAAGAAAETTDVASTGIKIGYNIFGTGGYPLASLANQSQVALDYLGDESINADDHFSVETIISDVENMISSGCDGIAIWLPAPPLYMVVANMCEEAGVYFVLNDKIPADPEIKEQLLACEYFAGAVAPANAQYGTDMANYALEQGWKTCILNSSAQGDASDQPRLDAFKEVFEAAGGEILATVYNETTADSLPNMQDALIACEEPDFIYAVGSDYALTAATALEDYPDYETKIITSGLDRETLGLLMDESSPIVTVNGDYWIAGYFSAVVLHNACMGNKLVDADGNAIWVDNIPAFEVNAEIYPLYEKYFLNETVYTAEETQAFAGASYDEILEAIQAYSLESRLLAKNAAGIIPDAELEAVGLK